MGLGLSTPAAAGDWTGVEFLTGFATPLAASYSLLSLFLWFLLQFCTKGGLRFRNIIV